MITVNKRFLQKKFLIFFIPALLLVVLVVAAAPGAIHREHLYRSALESLQAGDWDAAESALEEISSSA